MKLIRSGLSLFAAGWLCAAVAAPKEPVAVTPKGSLKIDELTLSVSCFKPVSWSSSSQESKYFTVQESSGKAADYRMTGLFRIPDLPEAAFTETLRRESPTLWKYRAEIGFTAAAELAQIGLCTSMPIDRFCGREFLIDGKKVVLPLEHKEGTSQMISGGKVAEIVIPTINNKITLRGQFEIILQDNRAYKGDSYSLRILFTPSRGKITASALDLSIAVEPFRSSPLDLSAVANMGFTDDKDGDGKGGWTDQGAENDLRMIPTGKQRWAGGDFMILDPAKNNGKSCLVLAGPSRGYFPKEANAAQAKPVQGGYLYLLHALAWPSDTKEIGTVTVTYADGTETRIPVNGSDVGNWWSPASRRNGEVVWTGENKSAFVGLYRSAYPIENKPIKSIAFRSTGVSVWGIVGASVSNERVPKLLAAPAYIIEGKDWKPIVYHKDFQKGSILDASNRLDAPAGKYGPLVVRGDKTVFRDRPDVPVRFYGANFCGTGQYLDKEWAERLADRIAALGYNAVRFHHHDNTLTQRKEGGRSTDLNPQTLDQLDYLIACFKKRGIYFTTDLYVSRWTNKGEIPEFPNLSFANKTYKPLVFVLDSAMENWKTFSKNWLTHVNPYTGLALKDEPALLSLSLVNEDNIISCWSATPESTKLFLDRFEEWKKAKGIKGGDASGGDVLFSQFLVETYNKGFDEMKKFVRDLGVTTMISDQNMSTQPLLSTMRAQYDYVDNHFYWDHPSFPETKWQLPSAASNLSAISKEASAPGRIAPTRLLDKPMAITEFDYAKPNFFRAEGAVLTGAYAALQDWDALYQFAYAHSRDKVVRDDVTEGHFDTSTDVVKSLAQRIGVRLFLDREMKPAPVTFAAVLTGGEGMSFATEYSNEINRLGLIARVGTLIVPDGKLDSLPGNPAGLLDTGMNFPAAQSSLPVFKAATSDKDTLAAMTAAGVLKPEWYDAEKGVFNASNGQITLDSKKETFKAVTPSCEALILPAKMQGEGAFMKVNNQVGRGVFSVMSADGKPLTESGRILLLHLTDSQASKLKFNSDKMVQMDKWGTTPFLAARGEAEIELAAAPGAEYTLYTVDTAGKRLAEVPLKRTAAGALQFPAKVFTPEGPVFAYELVRK